MAFRKLALPAEMGRIDLFGEAARSAHMAGQLGLAGLLEVIGAYERDYATDKTPSLLRLGSALRTHQKDVEGWLLVELQPRSAAWLRMLEDELDRSPDLVLEMLASQYALFSPLDAAARTARMREKAIRSLMRMKAHGMALKLLEQASDASPMLIAECREGLGQLEAAAVEYLKAASPRDALRCYRTIPDFDKSLELLGAVENHPARESLLWLRRMRELAAARPADFAKVMLPSEKKLLEQVLETSLGVSRKKAAAKPKAAPIPKAAAKSTRPAAKGTTPAPRKPRVPRTNPYF